MSKKIKTSKEMSTPTKPLDNCFIFTLITSKDTWKTKEVRTKSGTRNVLVIPIGLMDGTRSDLTIWGNGKDDNVITFAFTWFW